MGLFLKGLEKGPSEEKQGGHSGPGAVGTGLDARGPRWVTAQAQLWGAVGREP